MLCIHKLGHLYSREMLLRERVLIAASVTNTLQRTCCTRIIACASVHPPMPRVVLCTWRAAHAAFRHRHAHTINTTIAHYSRRITDSAQYQDIYTIQSTHMGLYQTHTGVVGIHIVAKQRWKKSKKTESPCTCDIT